MIESRSNPRSMITQIKTEQEMTVISTYRLLPEHKQKEFIDKLANQESKNK